MKGLFRTRDTNNAGRPIVEGLLQWSETTSALQDAATSRQGNVITRNMFRKEKS
jgi:hypothetical protein